MPLNKIVGLILARGGSKGIKNKNLVRLGGFPLLAWAIKDLKLLPEIEQVFVSSDDDKILQMAEKYLVEGIKRPKYLAEDETPIEESIAHAHRIINADIYVLRQATVPICHIHWIEEAIKNIGYAKAIISVSRTDSKDKKIYYWYKSKSGKCYPWFTSRINRQELKNFYKENGAFYILTREAIEKKTFFMKDVKLYITDPVIDIDTMDDLKKVEQIIRSKLWDSTKNMS